MKLCADLCSAHNFTDQPISAMIHPHFSIPYCGQSAAFLGIVGAIQYRLPLLTTKLNGSSVTATQSSRVVHFTAVDTKIRSIQVTDSQHVPSFTRKNHGVVVHPSVGVAAHGVASGDSAGEGGGVSHHNSHESCCDLHQW